MTDMLDQEELKQLALCYMRTLGKPPVDAVIMGLVTLLHKKELMIIPKLPEGVKLPDKAD